MMTMFETSKKSVAVAYLLWFFLGCAGGHRFYAGKIGSACAQLVLLIAGWLTIMFIIGVIPLAALCFWVIIDAFLIPGWIMGHNSLLAMQLSPQGRPAPAQDEEQGQRGVQTWADQAIERYVQTAAQPAPAAAPAAPIAAAPQVPTGGFGKRRPGFS